MRGDLALWTELGLGGDIGHGATMGSVLSLVVPNAGFLPLPQIKNEITVVLISVLVPPSTGTTEQVRTAASLNPGNQGLL